jgi:hypothetical protein
MKQTNQQYKIRPTKGPNHVHPAGKSDHKFAAGVAQWFFLPFFGLHVDAECFDSG